MNFECLRCVICKHALPFYAPNFKAIVAGPASARPLFWPPMSQISAYAVLTCESSKVPRFFLLDYH